MTRLCHPETAAAAAVTALESVSSWFLPHLLFNLSYCILILFQLANNIYACQVPVRNCHVGTLSLLLMVYANGTWNRLQNVGTTKLKPKPQFGKRFSRDKHPFKFSLTYGCFAHRTNLAQCYDASFLFHFLLQFWFCLIRSTILQWVVAKRRLHNFRVKPISWLSKYECSK